MGLKVRFFSLLKLELDVSEIEYDLNESITIQDLIARLDEEFNDLFSEKLLDGSKIKMGTIILVNGHNVIHLEELKTKVSNEDQISIFPPSGGG